MRLSIDNMPRELHLRFKSYTTSIDLTLYEAVIRLLEKELKERSLEKEEKEK